MLDNHRPNESIAAMRTYDSIEIMNGFVWYNNAAESLNRISQVQVLQQMTPWVMIPMAQMAIETSFRITIWRSIHYGTYALVQVSIVHEEYFTTEIIKQ